MTAQSIFEALEEADVGAYAVSVDQAVVFWNRAARRILGHSPEDVIGRRCYEVLAGTRPGALTPSCREGCPSIRALQARQVPEAVSLQILSASGERKAVFVTPMVVASADHDAPLLIHLLDDRPEAAAAERSAAVRRELRDREAHVISDHPVEAPPSLQTVRLAPRELEVLRLVALGRGTRQIADELGISPHTVRNHVRHFREKLNAGPGWKPRSPRCGWGSCASHRAGRFPVFGPGASRRRTQAFTAARRPPPQRHPAPGRRACPHLNSAWRARTPRRTEHVQGRPGRDLGQHRSKRYTQSKSRVLLESGNFVQNAGKRKDREASGCEAAHAEPLRSAAHNSNVAE